MQITIKGDELYPLLSFLEDETEDNNIQVKPNYEESSKTLDVSLTSIVLGGAASIATALLTEYFKKKLDKNNQNEITITRTNGNGDEIKLTFKNLTIEDAETKLKSFMA